MTEAEQINFAIGRFEAAIKAGDDAVISDARAALRAVMYPEQRRMAAMVHESPHIAGLAYDHGGTELGASLVCAVAAEVDTGVFLVSCMGNRLAQMRGALLKPSTLGISDRFPLRTVLTALDAAGLLDTVSQELHLDLVTSNGCVSVIEGHTGRLLASMSGDKWCVAVIGALTKESE